MRLLVTGGLGFIGSNFILHLLVIEEDVEILNIDNIGLGANPENLREVQDDPRYRFIKGDISKMTSLKQIISDVDVVVNLAAETHVDRSILNPEPFINSNYLGTYNLLECIRKTNNKIKYVQVSTDEVYGDILEGSFTEKSLLKPSNPYAATKAAADLLCHSYQRTYGLDIIITRCTNNFGPRQYPEKLIPKTIIRATQNLPIPIYGTGENIRDWLYVLDHCSAILHLLEHSAPGQTYNISAGNEISVNTIAKTILEHMQKPLDLMVNVADRPGHDTRYSLDSTKLRKTGWKPTHDFSEALHYTIDWYLENVDYWRYYATQETLSENPWKEKK